jgi:hypothetical protein
MRGKTGTPLRRSGADEPTAGVAVGSDGLDGVVVPGGLGVTPGGSAGVIRNGASGSTDDADGVAGLTVAEREAGHGSVRNAPFASARIPLRQRATTR